MNEHKKHELKKLGELKAVALINENSILFEACERQAKELCWNKNPEAEFDSYDQDQYDEYYAHYQACIKILEAGKKLPAEKIEKTLVIKSYGSRIVGACSFETPYLVLSDDEGRIYHWVSNKVEQYDLLGKLNRQITIKAYVKPATHHLYKVQII